MLHPWPQAWAALKAEEKAPFEAHAVDDTRRYAEEQRIFEDMQASCGWTVHAELARCDCNCKLARIGLHVTSHKMDRET